jgi:hypothetical protein
MLLLVWFSIRGVRLLTEKVNQVRCFHHGALPAPWFFISEELSEYLWLSSLLLQPILISAKP